MMLTDTLRRIRPRQIVIAALAATLLAGIALAVYLFYLNLLITETFEGRRWSLPARVYAQPLELYPGSDLSLAELTSELGRLGYTPHANLAAPGTYARRDRMLDVYLRAFDFPEMHRDSQRVRLAFDDRGISAITDESGRPVPLIRLDPLNIGNFFPSHGEDRLVLEPDQIPELLTGALIAVEDSNFEHHLGFDPMGIARAAWVNLTSGEIRQGGSTLTQQLVKSYYLTNRQTFERKFKELAMAIILELKFSKQELLDAYVNEIYLGQDGERAVHGFGLGAQFYFNRPLSELDVPELATLVAIIRGPSFYNPYRHPERTHKRRDLVLAKMFDAGLIDEKTLERSVARPFDMVQGARSGGAYYPAFMDLVRTSLKTTYDDEDLTGAGMRVFTTLSPRTQDAVEAALSRTLDRLETRRELPPGELQGAVVVADTQTGEIQALSGGRSAGENGFNRALNARRPIGSLIKPVIYLTALERGYNLGSTVRDAEVSLTLRGSEPWMPRNFDNEVHGAVPLVRAMGDSMNLATINLGLALGVDQVAARLTALTGKAPDNVYPSLLLGAEARSPLEVLSLYSTFASGGFSMTPKAVVVVLDEHGKPLSREPFELEQQIQPDHAREIERALEVVMEKGTGKTSRFSRLGVAGKTGTSDDYRDSWFAGFDSQHLAVVWVGFDDNRPTGMTGAGGAMRVWDDVFGQLGVHPLPAAGDDWETIEYDTGLLANAGCAEVVSVPLPADADNDVKSGCGIDLKRVANRLGRKFRAWLN
ncbi:MAG: penicillin-binding protein 1B [Pseudomonadales bacterium]|jgi:penicillin-binding protein 1B